MKIITRYKQNQILKLLSALAIICFNNCRSFTDDELEKLAENFTDVSYIVGGSKGMFKVHNTVVKYKTEG